MKNHSLRFTSILLLVLGSLAFSGCNTVNGAGKDVEKAGDKIQDASGK